jgi:hypothetical protein
VSTPLRADPIAVFYANTNAKEAVTSLAHPFVVIDDVLVPTVLDPARRPLAITRVGIRGRVFSDTALELWNYTPTNGAPDATSARLVGRQPVALLPSLSLQNVSFGNGSKALFTAIPDFSVVPGFGLLFIGLSTDPLPAGTGFPQWAFADGPSENRSTAFLHLRERGTVLELNSPGEPFPPNVSFWMTVEGAVAPAPTPEPATFTFLGIGCAVAASFARSRDLRVNARAAD